MIQKLLGVFLLVFCFSSAQARSVKVDAIKRNIASSGGCIQLDTKLVLDTNISFTAKELRMLRNSIFAQYGFKFQDAEVAAEMTKRGCQNTNVTFSYEKLTPIDRDNINLIKAFESALKESEQMVDFDGGWAKTASSRTARAEYLTGHYCYLSDSKKYFGVLYFNSGVGRTDRELAGMMSVDKPVWLDECDQGAAKCNQDLADRNLDSTSATYLDFATKGKWSVANVNGKAEVHVTINSPHRNVSNKVVQIKSRNYAKSQILDCTLAD